MDWLKWWRGTVTDPKFQWVAQKAKASLSEVVTVWAALLEHGGEASPHGDISGFDAASHDVLAGLPDGHADAIVAAMRSKGLIAGDRITRWDDRQKRDMSADRTRRYRDRMRRSVTVGDASQADCDRHVTGVTVGDALEERRGEERREEPPPHAARVDPPGGTPAPAGWVALQDRAKVLWPEPMRRIHRELREAWGRDGALMAWWNDGRADVFGPALEDLAAKHDNPGLSDFRAFVRQAARNPSRSAPSLRVAGGLRKPPGMTAGEEKRAEEAQMARFAAIEAEFIAKRKQQGA